MLELLFGEVVDKPCKPRSPPGLGGLGKKKHVAPHEIKINVEMRGTGPTPAVQTLRDSQFKNVHEAKC